MLWEDLRDGKLYTDATGTTYSVVEKRKRPDLLSIIPVNEQGQLKAPGDYLTQGTNITNNKNTWAFSDGSPTETAWQRSSEYPCFTNIA